MHPTDPAATAVTGHAIDRYLERVDRRASRLEARLAIQQILFLGRWRVRPRHWMSDRAASGVVFVYWSCRAHVCVIVREGVVVTVVTRAVARASRAERVKAAPPDPRSHARLALVPDWRWDGDLDFEDAA